MSTQMAEPPDQIVALRTCLSALKRIANYSIDPSIDRLMLDFGERKESLGSSECSELLALVAFTQQRSLEKMEAKLALRRLESAYPELAAES